VRGTASNETTCCPSRLRPAPSDKPADQSRKRQGAGQQRIMAPWINEGMTMNDYGANEKMMDNMAATKPKQVRTMTTRFFTARPHSAGPWSLSALSRRRYPGCGRNGSFGNGARPSMSMPQPDGPTVHAKAGRMEGHGITARWTMVPCRVFGQAWIIAGGGHGQSQREGPGYGSTARWGMAAMPRAMEGNDHGQR